MNELNLRIKKIILENLIKEDEFRLESEKNSAKEAVFALMQDKAKVTKVEESSPEEISNAMDANDFAPEGFSHMQESPIIFFTFNHKDYSFSPNIDKEYYYKTESSDRDYPGHEEFKLRNIDITDPFIKIYDDESVSYKFTETELGRENFKQLEKSLKKYIN